MKRLLSLILILLMMFTMQMALAEVDASEEYEVKEYLWNTSRQYHSDLVIKNTSGFDAQIEVTTLFFDKDGSIVGVSNKEENACEDGYETFWSIYNDAPFTTAEHSITLSPDTYYTGMQSSIELKSNVVKKKVIITAKNTGDKAVKFVEYYVIYLDKKGNIVDNDWGYLTDKDNEIKPGKTVFKEESSSKSFESAEVYAKGR